MELVVTERDSPSVLKQKSRDQSHPSVPGICEKGLDVLVRTAEAAIP